MRAQIRSLWLDYLLEPRGATRRRLAALAEDRNPDNRPMAVAATLLLARIYSVENDTARRDAAIASLGRMGFQRRQLLHSPPYSLPLSQHGENAGGEMTVSRATGRLSGNFRDSWIDVGFWVQPDGSVSELQVLRSGSDSTWADSLLESIRGRRYSPLEGGAPTFRMERYSLTSRVGTETGTRIPSHSPDARVEYHDLTTYEDPAPASRRD